MIRRPVPAWLLALALAGAAAPAHAEMDLFSRAAFSGLVDLRLATADGEKGWLDGGFGKLRYGGDRQGDWKVKAEVADAALIWKPQFSGALSGLVDVEAQPEQRPSPDLVQSFVQFKPVPKGSFRYSARAGLYWPEISLEHGGPAWTVTETITPSAINAWVGEEVKVLGAEAHVQDRFGEHEVGLTAGIFTDDDTSGTLLSFRGWAQHDVKSTAADKFPLPRLSPYMRTKQARDTRSRRELDGKTGWYARLDWRPPAPVSFNAFYYDNRGDGVSVHDLQWSWDTRFWNLGATARVGDKLHLSSQVLFGRTLMGFPTATGRWVDMKFSSAYLLATRSLGADSVSGRFDWFKNTDRSTPQDDLNEKGWSATAAYRHKLHENLDLLVEAIHVYSDRDAREDIVGLDPYQTQNQLQASLRISF
jgi:hypothetical protein